jgi:hypothetical protein
MIQSRAAGGLQPGGVIRSGLFAEEAADRVGVVPAAAPVRIWRTAS